jgi:hypothetical protein
MTTTWLKISTAPYSSIENANQTYRVRRTLLSLRNSNPSTKAPPSKLLFYTLFSGLRNKFASANRTPTEGKRSWRIFTGMSDANRSFVHSNTANCSPADFISYIIGNSKMAVTTITLLDLKLLNDVQNFAVPRRPRPTICLSNDGCSKLQNVD